MVDDHHPYANFGPDKALKITAGESEESPIRQALTKTVVGMKVGESKEVSIMCAEAFGTYDPDLLGEIPLAEFSTELEVGDIIELEFEAEEDEQSGTQAATIVEITKTHITYDLNHPLAGHDIVLDLTVLKVER